MVGADEPRARAAVEPIRAGIRGRCPRCGEGRIFAGAFKLAERCDRCGLDLRFADAGDGPVVFIILIVGAVVCGLALWAEVNYAPPLWLHFTLWVPLAVGLSLLCLRVIKGVLVTLQYSNKAAEGRIDRG